MAIVMTVLSSRLLSKHPFPWVGINRGEKESSGSCAAAYITTGDPDIYQIVAEVNYLHH